MTEQNDRKGTDPGRETPTTASAARGSPGGPKKMAADSAFDSWLRGKLHAIFDGVAQEPLPDELIRLIEQDRDRNEKK
ncbi:hypothetical protein [Elioraea rosea]|uniref:hypothetical protein n=1 Tax=Elioraea rosea TaxID=2492390 RepID=UPI001182E760|nr:hypothetical protein [Elioraea rosea]